MYTELIPTQQISFYGKAKVWTDETGTTLYSYGIPVLKKNKDGTLIRLWKGWSATTGRHIKAFCGLNRGEYMQLPYDDTR